MNNDGETVLVGDENEVRAQVLCEILEHEFNRRAHVVKNFNALQEAVKERELQNASWRLVLVAADLRLTGSIRSSVRLHDVFILTSTYAVTRLGCIYSDSGQPNWEIAGCLHYLPVPMRELADNERALIVKLLEEAGCTRREPPAPKIYLAADSVLQLQVRALDRDRDLLKGKEVLGRLISKFNFGCGQVAIGKLSQGKSGARVFWIRPRLLEGIKADWVLKLSPRNDLWKLELEIARHVAAQKSMGLPTGKLNMAKLYVVDSNKDESDPLRYLAKYGDRCAICYEFLGGRRAGFSLDLEAAINATTERLQFHTRLLPEPRSPHSNGNVARQEILHIMLDYLCNVWYQNPAHTKRESRISWQSASSLTREYPQMPPYQLASEAKTNILELLGKREVEEIGNCYIDNWDKLKKRLRQFIEQQLRQQSVGDFFARELSVITSPVHGDLNANNILLQFKHSRVFLIDFPLHQIAGHALQDFASLEVNLKFFLLDRQEWSQENRLPALDHSPLQLPLWQELDDHLLAKAEPGEIGQWKQVNCHTESATLIWELLRRIRRAAVVVQAQTFDESNPPPEFFEEYLHALLFYTVRAIGHPLTDPKRVLAIYSASQILHKLNFG